MLSVLIIDEQIFSMILSTCSFWNTLTMRSCNPEKYYVDQTCLELRDIVLSCHNRSMLLCPALIWVSTLKGLFCVLPWMTPCMNIFNYVKSEIIILLFKINMNLRISHCQQTEFYIMLNLISGVPQHYFQNVKSNKKFKPSKSKLRDFWNNKFNNYLNTFFSYHPIFNEFEIIKQYILVFYFWNWYFD